MALETDTVALLTKLTSSLESATSSLPEPSAALPPKDGISLLDIKTDLFLSYLQNLTFLILLKLRNNLSNRSATNGSDTIRVEDSTSNSALIPEVVKKLVELRVYLEKGVRPLESRLKYQIDKVLNAATTAAKQSVGKANGQTQHRKKHTLLPQALDNPSDTPNSASTSEDSDDDEEIDALSYRPNPSAFARPSTASTRSNKDSAAAKSTIYRPPRITPTALPTPSNERTTRRKPAHRAAMDDFIAAELSTAPTAEPSIGSTIVDGGRRSRSAREIAADAERRAYEEANYMRLPGLGKKQQRKERAAGAAAMGFGGDELRGLGEGVERIARMTGKRGRETVDGPRGEGFDGGYRDGGKRGRFTKRR